MSRHSQPAGDTHGRDDHAARADTYADTYAHAAADLHEHAAGDLFGGTDHDDHYDHGHDTHDGRYDPYDYAHDDHPSGPLPVSRTGRRVERQQRRRRRRRRFVVALSIVVVLALGFGAWQLSGRLFTGGGPADYSGEGTGSVSITVQTGDDATQIGQHLVDADVVKSVGAFTAAAKANSASLGIQPGVYGMHKQMSGAAALTLLLQPSTRLTKKVTIPEGAIEPVVLASLATALGVSLADVTSASQQIAQMGLPTSYTTPTPPTSLEGFLFPATYNFDPGTTPLQALQTIVAEYVANDRKSGISDEAATLGISAYQVLTLASIAEAEVKFPADAGKVTRVLLNRIAAGRALQTDATSAYAAKISGQDPTKIVYATIDSPYNTYTHVGLPPTPIGSPGSDVLARAADPDPGDWIYYVNQDAAGHLLFTDDEAAFLAAAQVCAQNGWGCG